ncbi:MAG: endonuclease III [candidate division Zixibacteria bacterium]|nr:endonuclease III [candidate division Zixibacteria bacterium]
MTIASSVQAEKKRAAKIVTRLKKAYPTSGCSLTFTTAHQLLVATILSAQATDEQVNKITPALFRKYRTIEDFAAVSLSELERDIRSIGLYRNKARSIKESAVMILHEYGGRVPDTLDEIIKLPGVGRKTGSVVLGTWYGTAEGIVVDTHVKRLSSLLKLARHDDALKIEQDLMEIIDQKDWIILTHLFIDHGRAVCVARRPRCEECVLDALCPSAGLFALSSPRRKPAVGQ